MRNLESKLKVKNTLLAIATELNNENITWGLGGSLLLYLHGIDTSVADIDIVIDEDDILKVNKIVRKYEHIEKSKSDLYLTEKFYSLTLNEVDIDLMIRFKVSTMYKTYIFPVGDKIIDKSIQIDETTIYLCSLKDWLEAYTAIGRKDKIELINQSELVK